MALESGKLYMILNAGSRTAVDLEDGKNGGSIQGFSPDINKKQPNTHQIWRLKKTSTHDTWTLANVGTNELITCPSDKSKTQLKCTALNNNDPTDPQEWSITEVKKNGSPICYTLQNRGFDLFMDLNGDSSKNGTNIQGYPVQDNSNQLWIFLLIGKYNE